jgi:hypothetical protein
MPFSVKKVDIYAVDVMNRPGMLARVLEALAPAGANLEFAIARRVSDNTSRVFLAPLRGKRVLKAAADVGLSPAKGMHVLRIEGPDKAGLGARLTRTLAAAGLNLRGLSAAAIRGRSVCYIALSSPADQATAMKVARKLLGGRGS